MLRRFLPRQEDFFTLFERHAALTVEGAKQFVNLVSGGALTLFAATGLGIPVSTTHTITGAIIGVGAVTKLSAIRWGVAGRIVWAWMLTIPCSAFIAAVTWSLVHVLLEP
jgi:phosphate/sulfate permease